MQLNGGKAGVVETSAASESGATIMTLIATGIRDSRGKVGDTGGSQMASFSGPEKTKRFASQMVNQKWTSRRGRSASADRTADEDGSEE